MSKTITIDDDVYEVLKKLARPLEDTPSSVIRRLIDVTEPLIFSEQEGQRVRVSTTIPPAAQPPLGQTRLRVRSKDRTPQVAFRRPILEVLAEMGGTGLVGDVLDRVRERMKDKLTEFDFTRISTGEERWRVYARWERKNMALEGLLAGPHGYWQLTEKERGYLAAADPAA